MKHAVWFAAAFGFALVESASAPEELALAPAEGLVLERSFDRVTESERESTSNRGSNTSTSEMLWTLVVSDELQAVEDGRVTRLARTYEAAEIEMESSFSFGDDSRDDSRSVSCDLDGATVLFEWDEDEQAYAASSDEADDEVVDRLVFDFDFTALLPTDSVAEGDEWEIDLEDFRAAIDPWRGLPWDTEGPDAGDDDEPAGGLPEGVTEEGHVTATFTGLRDEDGVSLAVVTLEGEVEIETDRDVFSESERGSRSMHITGLETRTLGGRAIWNLEGGYLQSLELEFESTGESTTEGTIRRGDREFEIESDSESETTTLLTIETQTIE